MNNKLSQVFLVLRKSPRKWNYGQSSMLKASTTLINHFQLNLLLFWWGIFDGTNIHGTAIYKDLYLDVSCIMITYLFPVTSVRKFLSTVIGFTIFHLSEAATGGVLLENVFLEISQNSQENTCGNVSFLIK